jgi:hypothetical protein
MFLTGRFAKTQESFCERCNLQNHFDNFLDSKSIEYRKQRLTALFNFMLYDWIQANELLYQGSNHYYLIIIDHPKAGDPYDFAHYPLGKCGNNQRWSAPHLTISLNSNEHAVTEISFKTISGGVQGLRRGLLKDGPVVESQDIQQVVQPREYPNFDSYPRWQRESISDILAQPQPSSTPVIVVKPPQLQPSPVPVATEKPLLISWKALSIVSAVALCAATAIGVYVKQKK